MNSNGGVFPGPGSEPFQRTRSLQKTTYSMLMGELFPDNAESQLKVMVKKRCPLMFAPYSVDAEDGDDHGIGMNNQTIKLALLAIGFVFQFTQPFWFFRLKFINILFFFWMSGFY